MKAGFILIDKESGITSHDVVDELRRITKIKKIGHAGTLDPMASGLLILAIGREKTRKLSQFLKLDKDYLAEIKLGAISSTFDKEGEIKPKKIKEIPSKEKIKKVIQGFLGEIKQVPPIFSAKKVHGKKLYELARKGIKIKPKPQKVKIYKIKILSYQWPTLKIKVRCSSGTYIRSLSNDIGKKLGCGGYLQNLRRIKIGDFSVKKAVKLEKLTADNWQEFLF